MLLAAVIPNTNSGMSCGFTMLLFTPYKGQEQYTWVRRLQFNASLVCLLSSYRFINKQGVKICVKPDHKQAQPAMKNIEERRTTEGR